MPTKRCPYCAEEILAEAMKCKHCLSWLGPGPEPPSQEEGSDRPGPLATRRLTRSRTDRMLGGVCGGLGAFLGIDATWIRIIACLATILSAFLPGVLVYILLVLVIPEEPSPQTVKTGGIDHDWS